MSQIPYLVVAIGCPSSGKSTVGGILREKGFVHLCTDDIRNKLFDNPDFLVYRSAPDFSQNEKLVQEELWSQKYEALSHGNNVYIDSCADRESWRNGLLNTGDIEANKYLLELQVVEPILRDRNLARNRPNDVYGEWSERWEPPKTEPGIIHIAYQNNTLQNLEFITQDLSKRF